jgi:hypothetical protein
LSNRGDSRLSGGTGVALGVGFLWGGWLGNRIGACWSTGSTSRTGLVVGLGHRVALGLEQHFKASKALGGLLLRSAGVLDGLQRLLLATCRYCQLDDVAQSEYIRFPPPNVLAGILQVFSLALMAEATPSRRCTSNRFAA